MTKCKAFIHPSNNACGINTPVIPSIMETVFHAINQPPPKIGTLFHCTIVFDVTGNEQRFEFILSRNILENAEKMKILANDLNVKYNLS